MLTDSYLRQHQQACSQNLATTGDVYVGPGPSQLEGAGDYFIQNCGYICGFQLFVNFFSIGTEHSYDMQT